MTAYTHEAIRLIACGLFAATVYSGFAIAFG